MLVQKPEGILQQPPLGHHQRPAARAYQPQISPKWIAQDGKLFWLVWTDFQQRGKKGELERMEEEAKQKGSMSHDDVMRMLTQMRRIMPYYSFNTQRVDLDVA